MFYLWSINKGDDQLRICKNRVFIWPTSFISLYILAAGSIIMASDKNNQYLVTGDVDGVIKVWEILEYATHSVSEPVTTTPRKLLSSVVKKICLGSKLVLYKPVYG